MGPYMYDTMSITRFSNDNDNPLPGLKRGSGIPAPIYNGVLEDNFMTGELQTISHYKNGQLHNDDGPAKQQFYRSGNLHWESWYIDGIRYCGDDLPAIVVYYDSGQVKAEEWFNGDMWPSGHVPKNHRVGNPARIHYYEDGTIKSEHWCQDGDLYREDDLPPQTWYDEDGSPGVELWGTQWKSFRDIGPCRINYFRGHVVQMTWRDDDGIFIDRISFDESNEGHYSDYL